MTSKKKELLLSATMKRTSDWVFSQEIPSDVIVHVGGASFSLHKFPLVSKCGYIRKLVSEFADAADLPGIEIPDIPGGAEAFELVAKFCYGANFEINIGNIATLRCAAEYLEMTEAYAVGNLTGRTEGYLNEVALQSLSGSVSVLRATENLLPFAENIKLVDRCIDAIAYLACKDSESSLLGIGNVAEEGGLVASPLTATQQKNVMDWWVEDLTLLKIDFFQRVLIAMLARGFKQYALGPILMLYAQKSLRGLDVLAKTKKRLDPRQEHEKRVVLETVVSLLPTEKYVLSVSFLSMLLRSSIYLDTTVACRLDLEKRMALQLGQAVLDDLLIPSYPYNGEDTLFDVDTVRRIMTNYLDYAMEGSYGNGGEEYVSLTSGDDLERVGKLMENYLAEVASDQNLSVSKFIGLVEIIPEQSRMAEDGIYRAIDIFLKAHPDLSDMERKKVCSVMECQNLSREACAHAAQNDRLPAQTVVQALYYEQQRFREATTNTTTDNNTRLISGNRDVMSLYFSPNGKQTSSDPELMNLRRENADLKFELVKMKMKMKEMEKTTLSSSKQQQQPTSMMNSPSGSSIASSADKPPLPPRKSLINSVSKKLGKLNTFIRGDLVSKGRSRPSKVRRHSIS